MIEGNGLSFRIKYGLKEQLVGMEWAFILRTLAKQATRRLGVQSRSASLTPRSSTELSELRSLPQTLSKHPYIPLTTLQGFGPTRPPPTHPGGPD